MKGKVLIIDDSVTQLTTFKFALTKVGYDVSIAKDGIDGIAKVYQTFPDIIISDIVMPEINGYQLCRVLKNDNLTKRIPIILQTSLDEKIDRFWGIKAGADSFVVKDGDISKLTREIETFLKTTSLLSDTERKRLVERKKVESTNIKSRVNQLLDQSLIESTITNEFRNLSELIHNREFLIKSLFSLLFSILDYQVAGIYFNDKGDEKKLLSLSLNEISSNPLLLEQINDEFFLTIHPEIFNGEEVQLFDHEVFEEHKTGRPIQIDNINIFSSKIVTPIVYGNQVLGGLCLYNVADNHFRENQLIKLISDELVLLMRIRSLYIETKVLAITDGLTKLYNRGYFQDIYSREFNRAKRYKLNLSLVMLDIDHFKKLNDTYGHQLGDLVLSKVSALIKKGYRRTDCVARYGGEEMVVICPETTVEKALIPTARLKKAIEDMTVEWFNQKISVTVSIGLSEVTEEVMKEHELLKRADEALYKAKETGRNRIVVYEEK